MRPTLTLSRARGAGFTLAESYFVCAIFSLTVAATVAMQVFGARIYQLAATKLTATASARRAMDVMRDAIRSASSVQVGMYSNNSFSIIADGNNQVGNALLVYLRNPNLTNYGVIYYMNRASSNICTVVYSNNQVLTATVASNVVAYITNYYVFDAEDAFTNIMTSYQNDRVIHIRCQFAQWEYPLAGTGNGALYDYYQLQTRVTRRIMDY